MLFAQVQKQETNTGSILNCNSKITSLQNRVLILYE